VVAITCFIVGLAVLGFVLPRYLKHDFSDLWDKELPVNAYKFYMKALVVAVGWVLPCLGVLLLLVAYTIWNYRRKRDAMKPDA